MAAGVTDRLWEMGDLVDIVIRGRSETRSIVTRAETAWIAVANWRRRAAYCRDDQERKVLQHLMQSWALRGD
jgi:hypothetical protein